MPAKAETREHFIERYGHYMTVDMLLKFIEKYNIPKTAKVMIQRVEDVYYENHGWKVLEKEGGWPPETVNEYHPAWSPVHYKDENGDFLFIDLHY
jgi:hypothetical protein